MNNFKAKEIQKASLYLQDRLDSFVEKKPTLKASPQKKESIFKKMISSIFTRK